jgi:hypothetical protein
MFDLIPSNYRFSPNIGTPKVFKFIKLPSKGYNLLVVDILDEKWAHKI